MEQYIPDIYQKSIYTIDYDSLINRGIKCLLFDLDNTIIPINMKLPNKKIKNLFTEIKEKGFIAIIFSDNSKKRLKTFCEELDIKYSALTKKTSPKSYDKIMNQYNVNVSEIAIIGDQLVTDIFGGNKIGITTILVNPISTKDSFFTKFSRMHEKSILKKLHNQNLFIKGHYYE